MIISKIEAKHEKMYLPQVNIINKQLRISYNAILLYILSTICYIFKINRKSICC